MNYTTSKNYEKLWKLVQEGKKIPCLYQSDGIQRAGIAQKCCGTPTPPGGGFCPNKEIFIQYCEADQVEMLLPNEWIKIESDKNLPPEGKEVLCVYRGYQVCVASRDSDLGKWDSGDEYINKEYITHWMPMPDAPKE